MHDCHHPEVRPDHHERDGAYVCVLCPTEFVPLAEIAVRDSIIDRLRRNGFGLCPVHESCWYDYTREPMSPEQVAVMGQ